jgi:hypothetical protein
MSNVETLLANANAFLQNGEPQKAIALLKRAKLLCGDEDPLYRTLLKMLSHAHAMSGDENRAEQIASRIKEPRVGIRERIGKHRLIVWMLGKILWLLDKKMWVLTSMAAIALVLALRPEIEAVSYWISYNWSSPESALKSSIGIFKEDGPDDLMLYNRQIFQYRTVFPGIITESENLSKSVAMYDFGTNEQEDSLDIVRQLKHDKYTVLLCKYKKFGLKIQKAYWLIDVGNKFFLCSPPHIDEINGPGMAIEKTIAAWESGSEF